MNKLANVVYSYRPKNDDELELEVGDKIEVIGIEEEGWWKGKLKGRIGVFPSNFVQVIESGSHPTQSNILSSSTTPTTPTNKLNLFGSKLSKNSLSTNSLNNNSNSINNNSNNNNNNNLIMNNTQNPDSSGLSCGDDTSINSSERRPKPIRGVGYGDIFASGATKPPSADSTILLARERLGQSIASILQNKIPRKPPPPAPTAVEGDANSTDEAPKLPPKPTPGANQFGSPMQSSMPQLPPKQQPAQQVREQARVIYEYEPINDDELAMQPGDIIDIIDKEIEDQGWWKGELNGKVGVFPDNFVQLLDVPEVVNEQNWPDRVSISSNQSATTNSSQNTEGKVKSVFAATPKGFSKELENNLEKHSSPASFLSLKRNKLQQHMSTGGLTGESTTTTNEDDKSRSDSIASLEMNTTKLNHITANRAKGPTRRPPSNILNKRSQLDQGKRESNGRDDPSLSSLPINTAIQSTTHDLLSSLPTGQHTTPTIGAFPSKPSDGLASNSIKPSLSLENVIDNLPSTPRTSQRSNQPSVASDKSKTVNTPLWMLELRKAQGQKKRESPAVNVPTQKDEPSNAKIPDLSTNIVSSESTPTIEKKSAVQSLREAYNPGTTPTGGAVKSLSSRYLGDFNSTPQNELQRNSLIANAKSNQEASNDIAPTGRLNSVMNKSSSDRKVIDTSPSYGLNANLNSNENGNSNTSVPSNATKITGLQTTNIGNIQPTVDSNIFLSNSYSVSSTTQRSLPLKGEHDKVSPDKSPPTNDATVVLSSSQYDDLLKISKNANSEISELREEIKRLREDFHGLNELKNVIEVMGVELKACQSATENQKRYIKELITNLADERKKIASMQVEIDRNFK